MASPVRIVFCACPPEEAETLAATLVATRLAACVNVMNNVRSVYRWQGRVERDDESLLIIKTTEARLADLEETIVKAHPHELPEIIAVSVTEGLPAYLDWVNEQTEA